MAQPMPESVKVARVAHTLATPATIVGERFDIKMDRNEVMVLLAFHWWWAASSIPAGINEVKMGLWRKSETLPAAELDEDSTDMLWAQTDTNITVAESMKASNSAYINLPWPMILIRPPQFVIRTVLAAFVIAEMRLYYLLREVNDVDLAKLMVKDHA